MLHQYTPNVLNGDQLTDLIVLDATNRNLALIGGGTGVGALIGGIATGGTGALIGSAIGGGGGTAVAYGTGKRDVGFSVERRLTFKLPQPLVIKS